MVSAGASEQATRGAEMFAERCKPCHGDVGQGLALWRLEWAPKDQNCQFTKCHGLGHPPDGFYMPRDAPPLIGKDAVAHFHNARHWQTAQDMFRYTRVRMPLDVPGELSESDYWAVIAYILRENGRLPAGFRLDAVTGAAYLFDPFATVTWLASNILDGLAESPGGITIGFVTVALVGIVLVTRRSRRRASKP
jgi:mono/diheme cytochrome c family protein